ncbi:PO21 protein, partial [Erpornis zantholeuca]|nr:PO21 protein [Erpornis zantholeuca]
KACDTVCHQHIIMGLLRRGVDPFIVSLMGEMHKNITTCILTKDQTTDPIKMLSGVKQGDLMSPVLFNLALDPLLCKLEAEGKGFRHEGFKITSLAFADDLVLLSDSWEGMYHNVRILETFCDPTGLQTQEEK